MLGPRRGTFSTLLYVLLGAIGIPFIPTAILKIILAGFLGMMLRNTMMKANVLQPEGYSQRKEAQNA